MSSELGTLLRALGREDSETISILTQVPGSEGILNVHWTTVADCDLMVDSLPGCNVWFGVQPIARPDTGRGRATDITAVTALYADLDWRRPGKPDGMEPSEALELTAKLSAIVGSEPVGIVVSGNGIQPYWRVERVDLSVDAPFRTSVECSAETGAILTRCTAAIRVRQLARDLVASGLVGSEGAEEAVVSLVAFFVNAGCLETDLLPSPASIA